MANALVRKTDPSKFITTTMQLQQQQQQSATMDSKARTVSNILKEPSIHTHANSILNTNTTQSSSYSSTGGDDDVKQAGATLRVLDFHRYIHKDTFNTKLTAMIAKRKHPPQNRDADECRGPKWDTVT